MNRIYDWYVTPEEYKKAKENNISPERVNYRIRYAGWSKNDAINIPTRKCNNREDWSKIAIGNGIKKGTFYRRIDSLGWSFEMAASVKATATKSELVKILMQKIDELQAENDSLRKKILELDR